SQLSKHRTEFTEHVAEVEEDADAEVLSLSFGYEGKLKAERAALSAIRGENQAMKGDYDKLVREIAENKAALSKLYAEEKRLQSIIKGLEKDIAGVRREMQERDDTIQDKEKRISDLKKKNQELEKFKFVLDYKIAELKKQVEPREQDIVLLSKQIKEMDDELLGYHKGQDKLDLVVQDLRMKIRSAEREARVEGLELKDVHGIQHRIQNDLLLVAQLLDRPNDLKRLATELHHKYQQVLREPKDRFDSRGRTAILQAAAAAAAASAGADRRPVDEPLEEELDAQRQREHLERTAATLRHKLAKADEVRHSDNVRIVGENVLLLSEANVLTRDLRGTQQRTGRLVERIKGYGRDGGPRAEALALGVVDDLGRAEDSPVATGKLPYLLPPVHKRGA
ncbi:Cilia- and flagella-associated protein 57, partial [Cladochytrium tenue]